MCDWTDDRELYRNYERFECYCLRVQPATYIMPETWSALQTQKTLADRSLLGSWEEVICQYGYFLGTTCSSECNEGHHPKLDTSPLRNCGGSGKWSGQDLVCLRKSSPFLHPWCGQCCWAREQSQGCLDGFMVGCIDADSVLLLKLNSST